MRVLHAAVLLGYGPKKPHAVWTRIALTLRHGKSLSRKSLYGVKRWPLDRPALGALGIALAILAHEYSRHAVKILNCTAAAFFAFSLVTTIAVGSTLFKNYNAFLIWSVFAIVTWVTLLLGFPFTIQYAREQAPPEVWDNPLFRRLNMILTVAFGLVFTVNAGLGAIALITGHLLTLRARFGLPRRLKRRDTRITNWVPY